jgi:hypothetical protein
MDSTEVDIRAIGATLADAGQRLCAAWDRLEAPPYGVETTPGEMVSALARLFDVLDRRGEVQDQPDGSDLARLTESGLGLIRELSATAALLDRDEIACEVELQAYPFAVWSARLGAPLRLLDPVVNAVAFLANHTTESADLARLFKGISEIIEAVDPAIRGDLQASAPGQPWRLLLLNRAIVATRSHDPDLMEAAFAAVVRHLPDEAARFFTEGMEQMELLEYPAQVRRVMQRYYERWAAGQRTH